MDQIFSVHFIHGSLIIARFKVARYFYFFGHPDPVLFLSDPNPDPLLFSSDPDPTCNNGYIRLFSSLTEYKPK